jgi:hypothetical protein
MQESESPPGVYPEWLVRVGGDIWHWLHDALSFADEMVSHLLLLNRKLIHPLPAIPPMVVI